MSKNPKSKQKENQIFTSTWVTNEMLDMLECDWAEDNTYLFEPSCGSGDMLISCLDRIYEQLMKRYNNDKVKSLADLLFKFIAVEIDSELVVNCRARAFKYFYAKLDEIDSTELKELMMIVIARQCQEKIVCQDFFEFMKGYTGKMGVI